MAYIPLPEFAITSPGYTPDPTYIFPVLNRRIGRLQIQFDQLTPRLSVGVSVSASVLDIIVEPLQLIGPAHYKAKKPIASRLWFLTVQGINGHEDIVIPISRFTESLSTAELAKYSLVVPDGNKYAGDLSLRRSSTFTITSREQYTDGTHEDIDSAQIPIAGLRSDRGANNYSVTITGELAHAMVDAKKLSVHGVSYVLNPIDKKRTIRCDNDKDFYAGDIAVFEGEDLKAGTVTRIISTNQQTMQLKEL